MALSEASGTDWSTNYHNVDTPDISEPSASTVSPGMLSSCSSPQPSSSQPSASTISTTRKRIRPKIGLAPDQPPTARGNPRVRVFVACYQCRTRKIRCDGAKPACFMCEKRPLGSEPCSYDSGPHRRGREKGSARSTSKGQTTQKRRTIPQDSPDPGPSESHAASQVHASSNNGDFLLMHAGPATESNFFDFTDVVDVISWDFDPVLLGIPHPSTNSLQVPELAVVVTPPKTPPEEEEQEELVIPARPSTRFARDTWWDALLTYYASDYSESQDIVSFTHARRHSAMNLLVTDLRVMFQASPCWLSCINLPRFFDTLFSPLRRNTLQPSFLLSALALGKLARSSEVEDGAQGREKALALLDMAHGALEASLATGWVDIGLAQAGLLIVYFEMHSHPMQTLARTRSSLLLLDSLMRMFSLSTLDEGIKSRGSAPYSAMRPSLLSPVGQLEFPAQPSAHYGAQLPAGTSSSVPQIGANILDNNNITPSFSTYQSRQSHQHQHQRGCSCLSLSLGHNWPSVKSIAPSWTGTMMWSEDLSEAEFKREESRRLVWTCVMTIATLNMYTSGTPEGTVRMGQMFVREPENFALLLPGEAMSLAGRYVETDDIYSLNLRTLLLFHVVMRTREDDMLSPAERAQISVKAWHEIDDIEARMARHTCDIDSSFGFESTEMLFTLRMLTSYDFRQFIPQVTTNGSKLFYRDKAEVMLKHVGHIGDWIWKSVNSGSNSPSQDHRKSLLVFWYVTNVKRALALWQGDHDLILALTTCRKFAGCVEHLLLLWPNMRLRQVWQCIRYNVVEACLKVGISPPSPTIPRVGRQDEVASFP